MANLPWNVSSGSQVDVKRAAEILDEDHYDLEKVKDRILDYLAVLQLRPVLKGPSSASWGRRAWARRRWAAPSRARSAANSRASPWAACTTRPRSAATAAPISERCRGRSSRRCGAPASTTRSSCWTKWTSWGAISAATPPRRCWKCSTRSRIPPSATTTWTCRSTCPRSCSSPRPTCSTPSRTRCATAWRSFPWKATPSRKR